MSSQKGSNSPSIELDHIGVAVTNHQANGSFWKALGWDLTAAPKEKVNDQKVNVAFLEMKNNSRIELLEPTEKESAIGKFLEKRGPGIHHLCFRVKNIESYLAKLKKEGVKLINETPVKGAHNCKVAFVHPSSTGGVLVELSEKMEKDNG